MNRQTPRFGFPAAICLIFSLLWFLMPGKYYYASGQRFQNVRQAEDTLVLVLNSINASQTDSSKRALNQAFSEALFETLKLSSSDSYSFDSLKTVARISSPDNKFRIFHWNLPTGDGRHHYFGFIKMLNQQPPKVYPLVDVSDSMPWPDTALLKNSSWFGALYYKIIPGESATGTKVYTLLGWAGKNNMITQKVIDILYFDDQDMVHFGSKLFPDFQGGNMTRIIFRFSATTTMSLKYQKQAIQNQKNWNSKKRVFEYTMAEPQMIVFDRMVPLEPQLAGQFQFYVAAGDVCDGFLFNKNVWNYMGEIDFRNKK